MTAYNFHPDIERSEKIHYKMHSNTVLNDYYHSLALNMYYMH